MDFTGLAEIDDLWNLHDAYTVHQAAALVAGIDPNIVRFNDKGDAWFEDDQEMIGIKRVTTALTALENAINGGTLAAILRRDAHIKAWDEIPSIGERCRSLNPNICEEFPSKVVYKNAPDWGISTVYQDDLVDWLQSRGLRSGFFFPGANLDTPGYLDPKNQRYAHKLAAAVSVWQAMDDENLRRAKKPIQAMTAWLESRYAEFGLTHKQSGKNDKGDITHKIGDRNDGAIRHVAQLANWETEGGAPKTPG